MAEPLGLALIRGAGIKGGSRRLRWPRVMAGSPGQFPDIRRRRHSILFAAPATVDRAIGARHLQEMWIAG
jgi:hypothetical protein